MACRSLGATAPGDMTQIPVQPYHMEVLAGQL